LGLPIVRIGATGLLWRKIILLGNSPPGGGPADHRRRGMDSLRRMLLLWVSWLRLVAPVAAPPVVRIDSWRDGGRRRKAVAWLYGDWWLCGSVGSGWRASP